MENEIINRVAKSNLITLDIEAYMDKGKRVQFDIAIALGQQLLLREKEFRAFITNHDWHQYTKKNVAVYCSEEVIIPAWAHMLIVSKLLPIANVVALGNDNDLEKELILQAIQAIDLNILKDKKVMIKGCSRLKNRDFAYFSISKKIIPVIKTLMYGEPCSTVPVYKRMN